MKGQYTLDYVVQWRLDVHFLFSVSERKVSVQNTLSFVMDASRDDSTVMNIRMLSQLGKCGVD